MRLLHEPIALRDVADIEGFVNATINSEFKDRRRLNITRQEREELLSEGMAILYELSSVFVARRPGHTKDGRFSGFASFYLPKRLAEAWHRTHEEHRYVTDPETGKRRYVYLTPSTSLDGLYAQFGSPSADTGEADDVEDLFLPPSKWAPIGIRCS